MTIGDFKREYVKHNPCAEGVDAFDKCQKRSDVVDLMLSPQGLEFLLDSIREGWGPKPSDIKDSFKPYINGRYTSRLKTESGRVVCSQLWCDSRDITIDDEVRRIVLVGCMGIVRIDEWQMVKIFVDSNSDVDIEAPKNSIVYIENVGGTVRDCNYTCKILNTQENGI